MAEQLAVHGAPVFRFDGVMAPFGIEAPFYAGWNIERDWIGARIWAWDRDFPFYWWEFGISLLLCYSISGFLLRRMGYSLSSDSTSDRKRQSRIDRRRSGIENSLSSPIPAGSGAHLPGHSTEATFGSPTRVRQLVLHLPVQFCRLIAW